MDISRRHSYEIFCDSLQEGLWFKRLNNCFSAAELVVIPNTQKEQRAHGIEHVLQYDRPDIILKDNGNVIFVLERTVEVPSGHNVGQRFGRLVAAAKERIPVVYFGPYMAYKHGGATAGPRYMNLRLFYSLKNVANYFNTAVTTINWPVDQYCEVLKTPQKDNRLIEYLELFMDYYNTHGSVGLTEYIKNSVFQEEQYNEQEVFAANEVQNPEQYDNPPDSVEIMPISQFERQYSVLPYRDNNIRLIELYHIGMNYIRSDPYAGMAALYHYLYCGNDVVQILHFPNIQFNEWCKLRKTTKTYRMYKEFSYAILFEDQLVMNAEL
jgi:hypothetical protein